MKQGLYAVSGRKDGKDLKGYLVNIKGDEEWEERWLHKNFPDDPDASCDMLLDFSWQCNTLIVPTDGLLTLWTNIHDDDIATHYFKEI